jgi:hypothetical protein
MKVRIKALYIFVSAITLASSCGVFKHASTPTLQEGTWQTLPITVDGDSKDWPSPYPNYDAKAMIAYATSNDKKNIYVTMETGDVLTQYKMLTQGMTVVIDTAGRKESTFSINYPLQNADDPMELPKTEGGQVRGSRQTEQKLAKEVEKANQFSLEGFGNCNGGYMVSQATPCGIRIKMRMDEYKQLVWEAVIPFKAIYNKDEITAADAGRPISVGFVLKGGPDPEAKTQAANNNSSSMASDPQSATIGRNTQGSRMQGGGMRMAPQDPMQHLYETTKTWKHFKIAWQ